MKKHQIISTTSFAVLVKNCILILWGEPQKILDDIIGITKENYHSGEGPNLKIHRWAVHYVIKDIDKNKSSGIDGVRGDIMISALLCLIDEFTYLCQTSVDTGLFPVEWCNVLVKPIPEDGDLSNVRNWRPISILPVTSKILEKVVYNHLVEIMEKQGRFSKNQYGYKRGSGMGDANFDIVNDLFLNRMKG